MSHGRPALRTCAFDPLPPHPRGAVNLPPPSRCRRKTASTR